MDKQLAGDQCRLAGSYQGLLQPEEWELENPGKKHVTILALLGMARYSHVWYYRTSSLQYLEVTSALHRMALPQLEWFPIERGRSNRNEVALGSEKVNIDSDLRNSMANEMKQIKM